MELVKSITDELVELDRSEIFPTLNAAMQWVMEKYPNTDHHIQYRMMQGVGTRAIVSMKIAYKLESK